MLRQMMKLEKARKYFKDGLFLEALRCVEDSDIREHLKARELREFCLQKLTREADVLEADGNTRKALEHLQRVREVCDSPLVNKAEEKLRARLVVQEEASQRVRQIYFRARLDLERGDPRSALQVIESVPAEDRSVELTGLHEDIRKRLEEAKILLQGLRVADGRVDNQWEATLTRAATLDPKSDEVRTVAEMCVERRIRALVHAEVSDGALAAYLVEHSAFVRRYFGTTGQDERRRLETPLVDHVRRRVSSLLHQPNLEMARLLLERAVSVFPEDQKLMQWRKSMFEVQRAADLGERGYWSHGLEVLDSLKGETTEFASVLNLVRRTLERRRGELQPILESIDRKLSNGEYEAAEHELIHLNEKAPRHEMALGLKKVVSEKIAEHSRLIEDGRRLLESGKINESREILFRLQVERCSRPEISTLRHLVEEKLQVLPRTSAQGVEPGLDRIEAERGVDLTPVPTRWMLAVEEIGEFLVVEDDSLVIGNAAKGLADVPVLANLAPRHLEIRRTSSYTEGVQYHARALSDRPVLVNGQRVSDVVLRHGDRLQLGPDLLISFKVPHPRSRAALIILAHPFTSEGTANIILLPRIGRAGAIFLARDGAHVLKDDMEGECEIYRDRNGSPDVMTISCSKGVSVSGSDAVAKATALAGASVKAGEVCFSIRRIE